MEGNLTDQTQRQISGRISITTAEDNGINTINHTQSRDLGDNITIPLQPLDTHTLHHGNLHGQNDLKLEVTTDVTEATTCGLHNDNMTDVSNTGDVWEIPMDPIDLKERILRGIQEMKANGEWRRHTTNANGNIRQRDKCRGAYLKLPRTNNNWQSNVAAITAAP